MSSSIKSLLGRDHLQRGTGTSDYRKVATFTVLSLVLFAMAVMTLCGSFGVWLASTVFGDHVAIVGTVFEARPLQAILIMALVAVYEAKVFYYYWVLSHSDTLGWFAICLLIFGYHLALWMSIALAPYVIERDVTVIEMVVVVFVFLVSIVHETLADRELTQFKKVKGQEKKLLDYGYHSMCRHPNYFFNSFAYPSIAILTGSYYLFGFWFAVNLLWIYTQSGPSLETYMRSSYGEAWKNYEEKTPFLFPKIGSLWQALRFRFVRAPN